MGMNIVSKGVEKVMEFLSEQHPEMRVIRYPFRPFFLILKVFLEIIALTKNLHLLTGRKEEAEVLYAKLKLRKILSPEFLKPL